MQVDDQLSTGLPGLDRILRGLMPGDNIVWLIDSIADYTPFTDPYSKAARTRGGKLVYFRFAKHQPVVPEDAGAEVYELDPEASFETFISEIHAVIGKTGRKGAYVFDSLSDLAVDWYSDQMLANFFLLTCPYIYDVGAIAYFALMRGCHSSEAVTTISETAQVLIDVYRHSESLYVHPLKVQLRHSSMMYMLHVWDGDEFRPVAESATIAALTRSLPWPDFEHPEHKLGVWNRTFNEAEELHRGARAGESDARGEALPRLLRMAVSRDERQLELVEKYLGLHDVLEIRSRLVGTGLIGGKSVGMLLARAILRQKSERLAKLLETHDSFYIGSDVFYTFVVQNGCWWVREKQKDPATFLDGAEKARQRMLMGAFPEVVRRKFAHVLDYYGQSPIIVRSSSLLEDNFGNSFAGKYTSVFCPNQGSRQKRFEDFLAAVRTIYASTMSERALTYRAQRDILDRDEQMALLVQRVSGDMYDSLFFPQIAGVGFSYNPYVWCDAIDPEAGVLRLVMGLGTRAVDRFDDDYTRIVALNAPDRRPEADFAEVRKYAQRRIDVLDLEANQLVTSYFADVGPRLTGLPLEMFASKDEDLERLAAKGNVGNLFPWVITFGKLLSQTSFVADMREMLTILQDAYDYPVEIEFTVNFFRGSDYRINLVQCRPLQVKGLGYAAEPPADIRSENVVLEARGAVIGQSRVGDVDRIVYVVPEAYDNTPLNERHTIARLVGKIVEASNRDGERSILLAGPGRWGTTSPSLGVPVTFAEIHAASVLCEIVEMSGGHVPDVSLGTHFFTGLVEMDTLYAALFPSRQGNFLNDQLLRAAPNRVAEVVPDGARWEQVVRVIDASDLAEGMALRLNANNFKQRVVCYLERQDV